MTTRKPIERYAWPATAALGLLALWSLIGEGRNNSTSKRAIVILMLLLVPASLHASGINDYQQGNYQGALKDFEQRIKDGKKSPEIEFDAGAAAYKAEDYKKAADYFSEAMTSQSQKIREAATYNLANSLVRTGEAAKEDDAKLSDWKNSLQHYETVLKSSPGNSQAKENRDIVLKLIEDLKKKQEQKKQQDKKNDQNQKKDQKKDQKDQKKNDQSQGGGKDSDQQKDQNQKKDQSNNQDSKDQPQNNQQNQKGSQAGKDSGAQNQSPQGQPSPQQDQKGGASPTPAPSPSPDQGQGKSSQQTDQQKQDQQANQQKSDSSPSQDQQATNNKQTPRATGQPTPMPSPAEKKEGALSGGQQGQKPSEQANAAQAAGDESKDGKMSPNQARALLRSVQDEEAHQLINQQNRATDQPIRDW